MVLRYFGVHTSFRKLKRDLGTNHNGTNVDPMLRELRKGNLRVARNTNMTLRDLKRITEKEDGLVIVHVDGDHIAVVHGVKEKEVHIADPSIVRLLGVKQTKQSFRRRWNGWGLVVKKKF